MKPKHISAALAVGAFTLSAGAVQAAMAEGPHSISANIGAVSNYIWRGVSQTQDGPAVQGGLDYAHSSGFYLGTWASNVDWNNDGAPQDVTIAIDPTTQLPYTDANGNWTGVTSGSSSSSSPTYELDVYTGFGGSINDDLSYDLNLIYYAYPDGRNNDFAEVGASGTYKWLTAGISYTFYGQADEAPGVASNKATFIEGDLYYHAALDFKLPYELGLNLHGGYYDFRYNDGGNDYGHWGASISRAAGDFGTFSFNYDQIGRDTYDEDPKLWVGWNKEF